MSRPQDDRFSHHFSRGRPKGHVFQTVSTDDLAPGERYEHWADDVLRGVEIEAPSDRQRRNFRARVTSLATMASEMHHGEADAYAVHITPETIRRSAIDELTLVLMVKGKAHLAYKDDSHVDAGRGEFFLLDYSRPLSMHFTRHAMIQLDLSRPLLQSVFPGSMPAPALINTALAGSHLARLLRDHLLQFPRIAAGMAAPEQLALLDASESFAITTIGGAFSAAIGMPDYSYAGLFAAAQRHIRRHLTSREINPASVAAAIGCSRSMLYKLFSDRGLTVQGYIRELRLQQLLRLLQNEKGNVPIHMLAQRCGLYDVPNVNRMFRNRFGMSPSEARASANQHPDGDR